MKPSLQLRLSQQLALTPQLQQSIRLLQLSTLELNAEVEQALADNPLLERLDDPIGATVRIAADGQLESPRGTPGDEPADGGSPYEAAARDEGRPAGDDGDFDRDDGRRDDLAREDWHDGYGNDGGEGGRSRGDNNDEDEPSRPQMAAASGSLHDHLTAQLATTQCTALDRGLMTLLIDEVDRDGYLRTTLEEIAQMLPPELEVEPEAINAALRLLQSFDPPGVGARSLSECLLLQLADPARADAWSAATVELARTIVRDSLPLLAAKDFVKLKRMLHCSDDELRAAQALIRGLNPRPGAAFSAEEPTYVIPDVLVRNTRNGWQATLNRDVMPRLRINDMYAQILKRNRSGHAGLSSQLQEARWLIKNVQQRFDTILRVSQAIVDRQRGFFSHGAVAMRPLVLREIADAVGLHESTVSRVTTQKFMLTPFGTFELKYFFGSHVATDSGGAASSTAIRELIKQLIQAEDDKNPLSDNRIAELLGEQGIIVARRTVAKYREGLRIPAVSQRKAL
jgi:RNA polymerase sigma-54 factor